MNSPESCSELRHPDAGKVNVIRQHQLASQEPRTSEVVQDLGAGQVGDRSRRRIPQHPEH